MFQRRRYQPTISSAVRHEFHRFEKQVLAVARCDTRGADVADEYFTNR
jgi:hypothetical protein